MACAGTRNSFLNVTAEKYVFSVQEAWSKWVLRELQQSFYWCSFWFVFLGFFRREYNCKVACLLRSIQYIKKINGIRVERSKITLAITNNLLKYSIKEMYFCSREQSILVLMSLLKELMLLNLSKSPCSFGS